MSDSDDDAEGGIQNGIADSFQSEACIDSTASIISDSDFDGTPGKAEKPSSRSPVPQYTPGVSPEYLHPPGISRKENGKVVSSTPTLEGQATGAWHNDTSQINVTPGDLDNPKPSHAHRKPRNTIDLDSDSDSFVNKAQWSSFEDQQDPHKASKRFLQQREESTYDKSDDEIYALPRRTVPAIVVGDSESDKESPVSDKNWSASFISDSEEEEEELPRLTATPHHHVRNKKGMRNMSTESLKTPLSREDYRHKYRIKKKTSFNSDVSTASLGSKSGSPLETSGASVGNTSGHSHPSFNLADMSTAEIKQKLHEKKVCSSLSF